MEDSIESRDVNEKDLKYMQQMDVFSMSPQITGIEQQIYMAEMIGGQKQQKKQNIQINPYGFISLPQLQGYQCSIQQPSQSMNFNNVNTGTGYYGYSYDYPVSNSKDEYEKEVNAIEDSSDIDVRRKLIRNYIIKNDININGLPYAEKIGNIVGNNSNFVMNDDLMLHTFHNEYSTGDINSYHDGTKNNDNNLENVNLGSIVLSNDGYFINESCEKTIQNQKQTEEELITPTYINMMFNATSMIPLENVSRMIKNEPIDTINEAYETSGDNCKLTTYELLGQYIPVVDLCTFDEVS